MAYALGIDLGTTYTAAALVEDGQIRVADLGNRAPVIPSVLFVNEDGSVLVGDAANRRAVSDPARVAREFKRRVGDPTAILLGGSPWSAEALMGRLLRWTVDAVTAAEGSPPARIALCRPANWGPYKQDLLRDAIRIAEVEVHVQLTEPEAAAISYASTEHVPPDSVVAVYDLGGGTFDAAVLRRGGDGFGVLGEPEGIERLGGIDFDQAVFGFVAEALGPAVGELDPHDPTILSAIARLRQECVEAKEALSADTETVIPVLLPSMQTEVRITRAEFEAMIRPRVSDTIAALRRALRSARVEPDEVGAVLLVGGSSRIPLVAELVGHELGRPVAVDAHPKHAVAKGAALAAAAALAEPTVLAGVGTDQDSLGRVTDGVADNGNASDHEPAPAAVPELVTASTLPAAAVMATFIAPPASDVGPGAAPHPPSGPAVGAMNGRAVGGTNGDAGGRDPEPDDSPTDGDGPVGPEWGERGPEDATSWPSVFADPLAAPAVVATARHPQPPREAGPSTEGRRRMLIIVGLAVAVTAAAVVVGLLVGGHAGGSAAAAPTSCPTASPAVCIQHVRIDGTNILADFVSHDVTLSAPVDGAFPDGSFHAVFFFSDTGPARGRVWGPNSPFGDPASGLPGFATTDATGSTPTLCALIQDAGGQVFQGTGNCISISH